MKILVSILKPKQLIHFHGMIKLHPLFFFFFDTILILFIFRSVELLQLEGYSDDECFTVKNNNRSRRHKVHSSSTAEIRRLMEENERLRMAVTKTSVTFFFYFVLLNEIYKKLTFQSIF